jgi:hypothetical protein
VGRTLRKQAEIIDSIEISLTIEGDDVSTLTRPIYNPADAHHSGRIVENRVSRTTESRTIVYPRTVI